MITVNPFGEQTVGVLGLGRSGLAAARALIAAGGHVAAWDDNEARREAAVVAGCVVSDPKADDWSTHAALVLSPGIPLTHPAPHAQVQVAKDASIPVVGDMELFMAARASLPQAALMAVTGTNGKSTTTALLAHVLAECGVPSVAAGNIGKAVMELDPLPQGGAYVFEVSSYQIDLTPSIKPDVAILLNITPDHLDRHGGLEGYAGVKRKIFANQTAGDWAVIGIDDEHSAAIADMVRGQDGPGVIPVSVESVMSGGVYVRDGVLFDATEGSAFKVGDLADAPALKGAHNWQNAAAAYAAASRMISEPAAIFNAICSFPGLPHRMEQVGEANGVAFINDSKATNQASAARALSSFDNIHWIAGGMAKEDNLDLIRPLTGHIAGAYVIGRDGAMFERLLQSHMPVANCGDLASAVDRAARDAEAAGGGVVLLSPAAASQDQFRDFEERGDVFRGLAQRWIAREGVA